MHSRGFVEANTQSICAAYRGVLEQRIEVYKSSFELVVEDRERMHSVLLQELGSRRDLIGGLRSVGLRAAGIKRELGVIKFQ